jgi:hypothetical protein
MCALMVFTVFQKLFNTTTTTKQLLTFYLFLFGPCPLVPTSHWLQKKFARINMSQATSGMILQNYRQLPICIFSVKIAALGLLKRVTQN